MFSTNGMCVRLLLINDIIVIIRLVLFEDLGNVNPKHEIYMYICEMRLLILLMTQSFSL